MSEMIQVPLDQYQALVRLAGFTSSLVEGGALRPEYLDRLAELLADSGRPTNTESPATPGQSQRGALRLIGA